MFLARGMFQTRDFLKLLLKFYIIICLIVSDQNLSESGHFRHQKYGTCYVRSNNLF